MWSPLACLGGWWSATRSRTRRASSGGHASDQDAPVWGWRVSSTTRIRVAAGSSTSTSARLHAAQSRVVRRGVTRTGRQPRSGSQHIQWVAPPLALLFRVLAVDAPSTPRHGGVARAQHWCAGFVHPNDARASLGWQWVHLPHVLQVLPAGGIGCGRNAPCLHLPQRALGFC